ncbi:TetR family transcriptional regulator [Mycolicibacterium chitae]|uniref:Transcriptional regulator n=1 Tax=Mycolicibacterium chitae TaxID=1792 RepID=A0A3S4SXE6_MYCCI|nr:TetR family transcriptional regulator [Mycolicibacterium chitae]MCV7108694.1 TetR family transcriptional regulator [Mycolicibacterium chitae]BBZ02834.1 TetR family transcriptional regulator [Mycolicibacterium chitae]VEG45778.1 transcriptional regulator [Mycolicibacterium chitae]
MVETSVGAAVGLRERKKRRTRATLIDAAVQLCLDQGYENTTVEQIAAVAEVSPRTFSRYFPTKDAVVLTLLEELVVQVGDELATIPYDVPVFEAFRRAHVNVLGAVSSGGVPGLTTERIVLMLRIVNSTPALRAAATEFKPRATLEALADRLGVDVDDRRVELVTAVWGAVIVTACGDLVEDRDGLELGPDLMVARISEVFGQFAELTAGLT